MDSVKNCADIVVNICNDILIENKPGKLPVLDSKTWDAMLQFASFQGVLPFITQGFENLHPDDPKMGMMLVQWYGTSLQSQQAYHLRIDIMKEMSKWFSEEGIDIMFIKGASLAQFYPEPDKRVFSDVDFYLFGNSEKGLSVMARHGIENTPYYHHHTQATYKGVLLENHYDFIERVNHKCDILLDDALKDLAQKEGRSLRAVFLGDECKNAYLMTPTMNAIFLIRHMSAHFTGETIPLRMLYDWALFIKNQGQDVDWDYAKKLYEDSGMMRFAGIVKGLLIRYLNYESALFPVAIGSNEDIEKVWKSIIYSSKIDPYKKYSYRYYIYETKIFLANRWKHKIVYPGESYLLLFLKYVNHGIGRMIERESR